MKKHNNSVLCSTEENKQGFTARQTKRGVLWVDRVAPIANNRSHAHMRAENAPKAKRP